MFHEASRGVMQSVNKSTLATPSVTEYNQTQNVMGMNFCTPSEPQENMEFNSKEDAFKYYKEYAIFIGFDAIIKTSRRSRVSRKFIDAKFVCTRYGNKRGTSLSESFELMNATERGDCVNKKRGRTNRSWLKTNCKACMHVKRRQDGIWVVSSFVQEHNHDLDVRNQALHSKSQLKAANIQRKKLSAHKQKYGRNECSASNGLQLGFREGDSQIMIEYFSRMQDGNPFFFYAVDLDPEQRLRNVLWIDAKSRVDYESFGDVVMFDTMYKMKEFRFPFAAFIGVNNHFQVLLLGCAFVGDESKSSYAWLIRAWLKSMRGRAPKVMLTDQDQALTEAVADVLPESRHCFSLWHILSKVPEKLDYVANKHDNFVNKLQKCVLKSHTEAQFETRWWKLVHKFDLTEDKWVQSLYDDRLKWIPTFMKNIFLAGLSSPRRFEGISYLVDRCLLRKTNLKEFLHQYNTMLIEKYDDEAKTDSNASHKQPILKSPSPYEKQMATVYTNAVFKKFQVEVLGVVACHPKIESKCGANTTFTVHDFVENQAYEVFWNEESSDASCTCRLFEFVGFLCRHAMIVLQISGVSKIPDQYILKRWTKNSVSRETFNKEIEEDIICKDNAYNDLCMRAAKLGCEGSLCHETYGAAFTALEEALRKCERINNSISTSSWI